MNLSDELIIKLKDCRNKLIEICEDDIEYKNGSEITKFEDTIDQINELVDELYSDWF